MSLDMLSQYTRTDSIVNFPSFPVCYERNGEKIVWSPNYSNSNLCSECTFFWINATNFNELISKKFYLNGTCKSRNQFALVLIGDQFIWVPNGVWREFDENGAILAEELWNNGECIEIISFDK